MFHYLSEDDYYVPPTKKPFISHSGRPQQQNSKHVSKKKSAGATDGEWRASLSGLSELDVQIIEDEVKEAERWNLYNWLGHGDLDPALWNYEYRGWMKFQKRLFYFEKNLLTEIKIISLQTC